MSPMPFVLFRVVHNGSSRFPEVGPTTKLTARKKLTARRPEKKGNVDTVDQLRSIDRHLCAAKEPGPFVSLCSWDAAWKYIDHFDLAYRPGTQIAAFLMENSAYLLEAYEYAKGLRYEGEKLSIHEDEWLLPADTEQGCYALLALITPMSYRGSLPKDFTDYLELQVRDVCKGSTEAPLNMLLNAMMDPDKRPAWQRL